MQRWEYRVVSLRDGTYTASLNEYGREGWELVSVVSHDRDVPPPPKPRGGIPMPRALGRLEDAANTINKLGGPGEADPAAAMSALLWILRRPLADAPDPGDD